MEHKNRLRMQDLPYNPQYEPKTLERAKAWLEAHSPNATGNATFAQIKDAVGDNDCAIKEHISNVCHAQINNNNTGCSLIASVIKPPVVGDEPWRKRWYEWLYTESPYRHFILSDLDFARVGIILSTDMPAPVLQNILILSRHGWEISREIYDIWVSCVNNGIPGWLAYATLLNSKHAHAGYGGEQPLEMPNGLDEFYLPHLAQHRAHWLMNLKTLTNFRHEIVGLQPLHSTIMKSYGRNSCLKEQLTNPAQSYRHNTDFYGGVSLFDDAERNMNSTNYVMELLNIRPFKDAMSSRRQEVRASIPDPFANRDIVPPGGMTYKDVIEVAMPFVLEHGLTDNHKETDDAIAEPVGLAQVIAGAVPIRAAAAA